MASDDEKLAGSKLRMYQQLLTDISESKVDWCDMFIIESDAISKLKKTSASPSDVFFIDVAKSALGLNDLQFSVKVFLSQKNDFWYDEDGNVKPKLADVFEDIEGLRYESEVYQLITTEIIEKGLSPNFIQLTGLANCRVDQKSDVHNLFSMTNYLTTNIDNSDLYFSLMVTGVPENPRSLDNELKILYNSDDDTWNPAMDEILFQILYSMTVMQKFGIVHNDLHTSNIIISKLDKPVTLTFYINETYYQLETIYIPYLFDWDLAYTPLLGANPKTEGFADINIKNTFSKRIDMYILFCYISSYYQMGRYNMGQMLSKLFQQKEVHETPVVIGISRVEYNNISKFRPLVHGYYRMGYAQMMDIAPHAWQSLIDINRGQHVNSIAFTITHDYDDDEYYLELVEGFPCRAQHYDNIPTPEEFIEMNSIDGRPFARFEVDIDQAKQDDHIYRCPTRDNSPYRYFSDVSSSRYKIVGKPHRSKRPKSGARVSTTN